jgi:hypothetical protein
MKPIAKGSPDLESAATNDHMAQGMRITINRLRGSPPRAVARLNGHAVGAGPGQGNLIIDCTDNSEKGSTFPCEQRHAPCEARRAGRSLIGVLDTEESPINGYVESSGLLRPIDGRGECKP